MGSFDILDPSLNIFQNRFLEASAGTGKTFAIEHLIVRLLIEGETPLSVAQILAVTFTRDAARDMKNRIRSNLEKLVQRLESGSNGEIFDYLKNCSSIPKALQRVQGALICFDEAQIFTIHGFCHQMLSDFAFEAKVGFELASPDSQNHRKLLHEIVKNYFLTGLQGVNEQEMEKLLKKHRNAENVIQKIMQTIQNEAATEDQTLQAMANECRKRFMLQSQKQEIDGPDELLKKMANALQYPSFVEKVRAKYRAAIVDEFQDTDKIQYQLFEKLFLNSGKSLVYFVGDPKQSIYGFRNADLYTYLQAAKEFETKNRAYLDTNFRSTPSLLRALNLLFSSTPHWNILPKSQEMLHYINVKAGRAEAEDLNDGKGSIHFFLAKGLLGRGKIWPTKELEEDYLFPFIAKEISELKSKVSYREMVVLIKDRYQAFRLQAYFQQLGIPSSIKRTLNLAETPAFQAMKDLISSLASPKSLPAFKTLLCGSLIGWEISKDEESFLSAQKKWLALHEVGVKSGFALFFERFLAESFDGKEPSVYEKLVARPQLSLYCDLMQLACIIIEEEKNQQLTIIQLMGFLEELQRSDPEEDSRLKINEEEEDKVPIMTLFASKGLEFEVVFALGLIFRQTNQESEDKILEKDAEKMRQLYVALTRAKRRVYIPLAFDESAKKVPFGSASPLELFAARWGDFPLSTQQIYEKLPLKQEMVISFLEKLQKEASFTCSWVQKDSLLLSPAKEINKTKLIEPNRPLFSFPETFLVSFSSLSKKEKKLMVAKSVFGSDKSMHTLPLGTETGILLHAILEEIFSNDLRKDFATLVSKKIGKTALEGWQDAICAHLKQLFHLPLHDFCLMDLSPKEYMQELEFLFPSERKMVKGFADLVFKVKGKYYFLDWKSNWLGEDDHAYTQKNLHAAMVENDYFLQAGIYTSALKRYVKLFDNAPFSQIFGGAFYIFIRSKAFYHFIPEEL